jgi:hypothetical protein
MTKRLRTLIGVFLFGGLLIAVCIKFFRKDINVDLDKTTQTTGKVIDLGVTDKTSRVGGRMNIKGKVFYLRLNNSTETLATYRPEQDYSKLLQKIHVGDTVTVYYYQSNGNDLNLDVFQIVKNGEIIQDYESYNKNHQTIAWVTGIFGVLIIGFGIFSYKKGWS